MVATLVHFSGLLNLAIVTLSIFMAIFLFWRAGVHELLDSEFILDIVIVSSLGGLVVGRIWDFLVRFDKYQFLPARLVFFNAFPGIDFAGILLGFCLATFVFTRSKKINFLEVFDLAAAPIVFAQSLVNIGRFGLSFLVSKNVDLASLYFGLGYFVIFWALKRLGKRKRRAGFFACFYLVSISILEIGLFWTKSSIVLGGLFPYRLVLGIGLLVFSCLFWYACAHRNLKKDTKAVFSFILLFILKAKRMAVSADESGNLARFIILSPYHLAKSVLKIIKFLGSEALGGLGDFLIVLGIKKLR